MSHSGEIPHVPFFGDIKFDISELPTIFLHCVFSNDIKFDISALHTSTKTTPQGSNKTFSAQRGERLLLQIWTFHIFAFLLNYMIVALMLYNVKLSKRTLKPTFLWNYFFHCSLIKACLMRSLTVECFVVQINFCLCFFRFFYVFDFLLLYCPRVNHSWSKP